MILWVAYRFVVHQNIPALVRRFTCNNGQAFDERFAQVLRSFLTGHNLAANRFIKVRSIRNQLDSHFENFYRGFAYEGTGMGFGARAMLHPWRQGKAFERYIYTLGLNHIYQYYVGLGWWLYSIYGFRPAGYRRWMRHMDPYYSAMLFDGVGFKAGLLEYGINPVLLYRLKEMGEVALRIGCQGFGRSLWFQCRFEISTTLGVLPNFPEETHQDIISGVGLAVAYSQFDRPERVHNIYQSVPEQYQVAFWQGMSFGWEARKLQNESYWNQLTDTFEAEWRARMEAGVKMVHQAKELSGNHDPTTHYIRWMDHARSLMELNNIMGGLTCIKF